MKTILFLLLSISIYSASAQKTKIYQQKSVAIKGYDAVSYFDEGMPIEGKKEYSRDWKGATWYFSSKQHAELFASNPEQYTPQFGGYCAYAASQGYLYRSDPNVWKIVDRKLYLNYDTGTQQKWTDNQSELIQLGLKNWPTFF
jgi:YHS domain-containing protein